MAVKSILMRKMLNDKYDIRNFWRQFFFGMSSDEPAFIVPVLQVILNYS